MPRRNKLRYTGPLLILAAVLILVLPVSTSAQDVAVAQATANVLASLAVTAVQDLDFGDILQGVMASVPRTDAANAGIFQIDGEATNNREVDLYMQLPEYIWNSTPGSEDRLVIYFKDDDVTIDTTLGTPDVPGAGALVGEDPHNLPNVGIGGNDGLIRLYLGGYVYPTVDQAAGAYTGDITLTAAYTGN